MKKLTEELTIAIELIHNVYVDRDTSQYNNKGYDEETGWSPIPEEWIVDGKDGDDGIYID